MTTVRQDGSGGFSLIELMVAIVIVTIVAFSSARFFSTPPEFAESRRRAAVEKAAGILDMALAKSRTAPSYFEHATFYHMLTNSGTVAKCSQADPVVAMSVSPGFPRLYYTLRATNAPNRGAVYITLYEDREGVKDFARLHLDLHVEP